MIATSIPEIYPKNRWWVRVVLCTNWALCVEYKGTFSDRVRWLMEWHAECGCLDSAVRGPRAAAESKADFE